jgi:hypothetical protein
MITGTFNSAQESIAAAKPWASIGKYMSPIT